MVVLMINDLLGGQAEDECILLSDLLHNLNVRAVHRAECQRAVQHQLHVRGSGRFLGSSRNLLGDIRCREDQLRV